MKALCLALFLSTFALCPPEATRADLSPYADDVAAVRASWAEDEALPSESCSLPYIALQPLSGCGDAGPCVGAYTVYDHRQFTFYVHDGFDAALTHALVRHESVHWLAWCTGYASDGDRGHAEPRLWNGVLGRAEVAQ